jgi:hypothetical protein
MGLLNLGKLVESKIWKERRATAVVVVDITEERFQKGDFRC